MGYMLPRIVGGGGGRSARGRFYAGAPVAFQICVQVLVTVLWQWSSSRSMSPIVTTFLEIRQQAAAPRPVGACMQTLSC